MQLPSEGTKICSQCQTPAPLDAPLCENCLRVFPMQTATPPPPVFIASDMTSSSGARFRWALAGSVVTLLIQAVGFGIYSVYADYRDHQEDSARRAAAGKPASSAVLANHALSKTAPNPQFSRSKDRDSQE